MALRKVKISKLSVAMIQLRSSIQHFNKREYIQSITLAGAADEILSQMALKNSGYNTLDGEKHFWDGFADMEKFPRPSRDKILKVNNRIKNTLKHHNQDADTEVVADFEFEAQNLIDSAIRNYWMAFDNPPKDRIIQKYVNWQWT